MTHWLDRLLNPQTIAIVGASARIGSLAATTHRQLSASSYAGDIYSVNPKYQYMHGQTCYDS
jgi:acyl-CoA synthetase (NDP forming)